MNRQNDASFGMYKTSHTFLTANTATITAAGTTILNTYAGDLETLIDAIRNTSEQATVDTKPITEVKKDVRKDTTDRAVQITGAVFSYATDLFKETGDRKWSQLAAQMEVMTAGFFGAQKDEAVTDSFYNVWLIANDLESASPQPSTTLSLSDYGIKPDVTTPTPIPGTLTLFDNSITEYTDLSTKPREAISTRKTNNQKLDGLYDDADALLEKADRVVFGMQRDYPDFYNGWQNARIIVLMSLRTQIVGQVNKITDVNLGTTAPVEGATVTILPQPYTLTKNGQTINVESDPIIVKTDAEGKYAAVTRDIHAEYIVKCSKVTGFGDDQVDVPRVKKGKKKRADFLLKPIQSGS